MDASSQPGELRRERWLVWSVAAGFLALYLVAALRVGSSPPFSSPDETANRFFAVRVAETGVPDALAVPGEPSIRPRSIGLSGDRLVPSTFLGLPLLYGAVGRLFGLDAMGAIAPILAVLGALAFEGLVRALLGIRVAFVSMLLLLTHPVYWYYATHGYWHNGPFVALLLCAAWLLYRSVGHGWLYAMGGGIVLGLALAFRTAEAPWVVAGTIVALGMNRKRLRRAHLLVLLGVGLVGVPLLAYQGRVFGNAVAGAYAPVLAGGASQRVGFPSVVFHALFPFGLSIGPALTTFVRYSGSFLYGTFVLGVLGAVWLIIRRTAHAFRGYAIGFLALAAWLGVYYGNFSFVEFRPDPNAVLLGSSYFRYWLPVYVAGIPAASFVLLQLRNGPWGRGLAAFGVAAVAASGVLRVTIDPHSGIAAKAADRRTAIAVRDAVLRETPTNAVVLAGPLDKVLWPNRQVAGYDLVQLPDALLSTIPSMATKGPLYFIPAVPGDADRIAPLLAPSGFRLSPVAPLPNGSPLLAVQHVE